MSKRKINPAWLKAPYRIEFLIEMEPLFKRDPYTAEELMKPIKRKWSFNVLHNHVQEMVAKVVKAYQKK